MPKLWLSTIEAHRREVRRAILDTTAALVAERGIAEVTMSEIAQQTGIGRATLYKYFPDVESILDAWHEDHVARHLERLAAVRDRHSRADERLEAVLAAYAEILHQRSREPDHEDAHLRGSTGHRHAPAGSQARGHAHGRHAADVTLLVHRTTHVHGAQRRLASFLRNVLNDAKKTGHVRTDISSDELATFCLHALAGAGALGTQAAVARLVGLTIDGLRSERPKRSGRSALQ